MSKVGLETRYLINDDQSDQRLPSRLECKNIASHHSYFSLSQKYRLCTIYNLCNGRAVARRSPSELRDDAQRNGRLLGEKPWAEWGYGGLWM